MAANTPDVHSLLEQGMDALRQGDKAQARDLLTTVLEMDDRNELAWLWLSGAVDSPAEQRICLENVLTINPGSTAARGGLAELDRVAPAPPSPPSPPVEPPSLAESPAAEPAVPVAAEAPIAAPTTPPGDGMTAN